MLESALCERREQSGWGTYKARNANLGTSIAKLCERSMEQAVLFAERFDGGIGVRLLSLEGHVCVCDLRDR